MNLKSRSNLTVQERTFTCRQSDFDTWVSAHAQWWPNRDDPSVWGRFATQASSGRYTFSQVNQPNRHFAETLVGSILEADGYVCWTAARILRKPSHAIGGFRGSNTRLIEALLESSVGFAPQRLYEREYKSCDLRLKTVDVIGYHCRRNHWVFAEVKKDHDQLHIEQEQGLRFLRGLFPAASADVFVALVKRSHPNVVMSKPG
jgi:hypothetical protein